MVITTKFIEDEVFEAKNEDGKSTRYDMRPKEVKVHLSPVESLMGSLATCLGGDVVTILKKRKKTVNDLTLVINAERRESHPRSLTAIHCKMILESPDATIEELSKAGELVHAKYCSVASSLKTEVELSFEVVRPK